MTIEVAHCADTIGTVVVGTVHGAEVPCYASGSQKLGNTWNQLVGYVPKAEGNFASGKEVADGAAENRK